MGITMQLKRHHIGIFGRMNAGKSSLMNLITQQETSIVDATPGTTTDTKISFFEIHGLGPVKLYDTAGYDEPGELGGKKRDKVLAGLKECDLILLVINPAAEEFVQEEEYITQARELDKQILIVYNLFHEGDESAIPGINTSIPCIRFYPAIRLRATATAYRHPLLDFILAHFIPDNTETPLLPRIIPDEYYILNIPMDEETPEGRFLRPQSLCMEYLTRNRAYPVGYRMDLTKARAQEAGERRRFMRFLEGFSKPPALLITDSQAMDIIHEWVPEALPITTFSIMMINFMSGGRLEKFAQGITAFRNLGAGDKILIVEACNHSRIREDIGTVQIPRYIEKTVPGVIIEHNFGREFQENKELEKYKAIIHCGGCMISKQKLAARLRDLDSIGVPYTNYGIFLSYMQGNTALQRVLAPWRSAL